MARTALFLPDGVRVLTAGDDGEIVLSSLADGAVLHVFSAGENGGVNKLAIVPGRQARGRGHDAGAVLVWDSRRDRVLHVLPRHDWSIRRRHLARRRARHHRQHRRHAEALGHRDRQAAAQLASGMNWHLWRRLHCRTATMW